MLSKYLALVLFSLIGFLAFATPYTAPTYNDINFTLCSEYTSPTYNDINFTLGDSDACSTGYVIDYSSNVGSLKFLNCSPDWEFYPTAPSGQTSGTSSINATNNGTSTGDFQIKYIGSLNTGWTLFSCNDSSTDPDSDSDCITMSGAFQTIWGSVSVDDTKRVWLYGNCSYISANPGVTIDMQGV